MHKYHAKKVTIDDITFDSKAEARRYSEHKIRQKAHEIEYFLMQVPFNLPGGIKYKLDFMIVYRDGRIEYEDVKGFQTAIFKLKKKQVESLYGITIKLLKYDYKRKSWIVL